MIVSPEEYDPKSEKSERKERRMKSPILVIVIAAGLAAGSVMRQQGCIPPAVPTPIADAAVFDVEATPDASPGLPCLFTSPKAARSIQKPRIVGGSVVPEGAFLFEVGIATSSRFQYCGGSLIGAHFVLTAAHCQVASGDLVLVGSRDLNSAKTIRIKESRIHTRYDPQTFDYDVAIAVLEEDATSLPLIPLAETAPSVATVIGWGATAEGASTTNLLRQVEVPIWTPNDCRKIYPSLTSRQVCAGLRQGGGDSCQGDSGGAMVVKSAAGQWSQLCVVSYGIGCARPGIPGVYTDLRVSEIRSWVEACSK